MICTYTQLLVHIHTYPYTCSLVLSCITSGAIPPFGFDFPKYSRLGTQNQYYCLSEYQPDSGYELPCISTIDYF